MTELAKPALKSGTHHY